MTLTIIVLTIDALVWIACGLTLYRNHKVSKLRQEIIGKIFEFMDWEWRVVKYHEVSYNDMVFSVKPIKAESFYKDTSFLEPAKGLTKSPFQPVRHD